MSGQADAGLLFGAKGIEMARTAGLKIVHAFEAADIRSDARLKGLVELRTLTIDYPFLEANEAIVSRLVQALAGAADWARSFPKQALSHIAEEGKVEAEDAVRAYGDLIPESTALGAEDARLADIKGLLDWLKPRQAVPETLDLGDWSRTDLLIAKEVKGLNAVA